MTNNWSTFVHGLQTLGLFAFSKSFILFIVGLFVANICSKSIYKFGSRYVSSQQQIMLIRKAVYFTILILFIVAALQELGFKLSVLLGSAGIATAAIAFAAQTSISNIISGIFLILEKSFQVGDQIRMGSTSGTIISIDLLSMKVLTADHTLVRIPNETVIKSEIVNITRYEKRRLVIPVNISYQDDLENVKQVLIDIAKKQPLLLHDPEPTVVIESLGKTTILLHLIVWSEQKNILSLRNTLYEEIKNELFIPQKIKYQKKKLKES